LLKVVVQVVKQLGKQLMAIPSVIQGTIEVEGKVFELDSPKGAAWMKVIGSFRFEPTGGGKPYTVRKEASGYWYGCRKVAGKVRKKYIGKISEVSVAKLEEIAEALEVPPAPRVNKVAEATQGVEQEVIQDRFTALELEVANLRKALEALQESVLEKSKTSDSEELPKIDNEVAEELHNELSNPKAENEYLRQKLAESRDTIETLNWGTEGLNQQLEALGAENDLLKQELAKQKDDYAAQLAISRQFHRELQEAQSQLETVQVENQQLHIELSNLRGAFPEPADLLNHLKAKRRKATASLADVEAILEILEG
jgi:chromosome segregation ATPase